MQQNRAKVGMHIDVELMVSQPTELVLGVRYTAEEFPPAFSHAGEKKLPGKIGIFQVFSQAFKSKLHWNLSIWQIFNSMLLHVQQEKTD